MKPTPIISEKKAAIVIWIGAAAVFTIGAMIFGQTMRRLLEPWTTLDDERLVGWWSRPYLDDADSDR
jgi:hypothetical protein